MHYKIKATHKTVAKVYQGLPDSLLNNVILNHHLVYARQLLFFRKQRLRKFYFRMSLWQWKHFLTVLALMPFYFLLRYLRLFLNGALRALRFFVKKAIMSY